MSAKKKRKPRCQWIEGVSSSRFSALHTCPCEAKWDVVTNGVKFAKVCDGHSIKMTLRGFQVR